MRWRTGDQLTSLTLTEDPLEDSVDGVLYSPISASSSSLASSISSLIPSMAWSSFLESASTTAAPYASPNMLLVVRQRSLRLQHQDWRSPTPARYSHEPVHGPQQRDVLDWSVDGGEDDDHQHQGRARH